jgi:hypothetical protein
MTKTVWLTAAVSSAARACAQADAVDPVDTPVQALRPELPDARIASVGDIPEDLRDKYWVPHYSRLARGAYA